MSDSPNLAAERLAHTFCNYCPLKGQRVVGTDGDPNASHLCIVGDAVTKDDAEWGLRYGDAAGRPMMGATGYYWKKEQLEPAGFAQLVERPGRSDYYRLKDIFVTPLVMCQVHNTKKDKLQSTEGRKAIACCGDSLRLQVKRLLDENPERSIAWMGAHALTFGRGKKTPLGPWRGRPIEPHEKALARLHAALEPIGESEVLKIVMRGVPIPGMWKGKTKKEAAAIEFAKEPAIALMGWKRHIALLLQIITKGAKEAEKAVEAEKMKAPPEFTQHELVLKLMISRLRAARTKREKLENEKV